MENVEESGLYAIESLKPPFFFFPNCSILEATNSANGSYAWKSILSARNVVWKGVVWWIGDGKLVCIKEDKWLSDQVYKSVTLPPGFYSP